MFSREQDIIQTMRLIENLKLTLMDSLSAVYHAMTENSSAAIKRSLARLLMNVYLLGRRLGVEYSELDREMLHMAERQSLSNDDIIENRFGDYSRLVRYLQQKRS